MSETNNRNRCAKCGGETARATVKAGNQEATLVIAGKPDGFLGVIPYTMAQIAAYVCGECGFVEFYARNVQDLLSVGSSN